jgi:hypothetical protein
LTTLHANANLVADILQAADLRELAISEIAHRHVALQDATLQRAARGAPLVQTSRACALLYLAGRTTRHLADLVAIDAIQVHGAARHDGLELLGPHYRAHARTAGGILETIHYAGVLDHALAARPDHDGIGPRLSQLLAQKLLGLFGGLAPEMRGVPDLGLAILDPDIHGLFGSTLNDHGIEPGPLEISRPEATHLRSPK